MLIFVQRSHGLGWNVKLPEKRRSCLLLDFRDFGYVYTIPDSSGVGIKNILDKAFVHGQIKTPISDRVLCRSDTALLRSWR